MRAKQLCKLCKSIAWMLFLVGNSHAGMCLPDSSLISIGAHRYSVDHSGYIRRFSSAISQSEYSEMLVAGPLVKEEEALAEINNRNKVKVYIHLINGLSVAHYHSIPEHVKSISDVTQWSASQQKIEAYDFSMVSEEAKTVASKIAARETISSSSPVIVCSIVEYEVRYGMEAGRKIRLFHSTAFNLSGYESYLQELEVSVKAKTWDKDARLNLNELIGIVRAQGHKYITSGLNGELVSLREKLMATHVWSGMDRAIDTLHRNYILGFDPELRGHVINILMSPSDLKGTTTAYGAGGNGVKDPDYFDAVLKVLEHVPDYECDDWFKHLTTAKLYAGRTLLANLTEILPLNGKYEAFIKVVNKQFFRANTFSSKRDDLLEREERASRLIVWDKSYFLNLFEIPPIGTHSYEVELQADGKIKLTKTRVDHWDCRQGYMFKGPGQPLVPFGEKCTARTITEPPIVVDPFDVIGFLNRSDLVFESSASTRDSLRMVPAVYLLYASQSRLNKNIGKAVSLSLDVISLAAPVSKIKYGPRLMRELLFAVELSDKVASTLGLTKTLGLSGGKTYDDIVDRYNAIHFFLDPASIIYELNAERLAKMADFAWAVEKEKGALQAVASESAEVRYVLDVEKRIDEEMRPRFGQDWINEHATKVKVSSRFEEYIYTSGKIVIGEKNLLNVPSIKGRFKRLGTKQNPLTAGEFWLKEGENIVQFTSNDGKYYIKHDEETGQLLFAKIDGEVTFLSYAIDEEKLINKNYDQLLTNLKTIHGLPGGKTSLTINGQPIALSKTKANAILGKYGPGNTPFVHNEVGTDDLIKGLWLLKNYSFADNKFSLHKGSIHMLNIPDGRISNYNTFFEDYNKDFLDYLISNKEYIDVVFVTDPRKQNLLDLYDPNIGQFLNLPTGFSKEIRYLRERGITEVKLRDGSTIDLMSIDLDFLNWKDWPY